MSTKYLIKKAIVITVDDQLGTIHDCDVLIDGTNISAVGPNLSYPPECTIIDGTNAIVSPGFIDTHRHTWQSQMRTIATDYVLSDYILALRNIYGSSYTPEDAYIGNLCGALESINSGITCLLDHSHIMNSPEHADAAVKGLRDAKIRGTFCYATYKNPSWQGSCVSREREATSPDWRLQDARRIKETHFPSNTPQELLRFGFALSEPDLTPIDRLAHEIEYARSIGAANITAHISFGKWDPGNMITRQLNDRNLLGPDLVLSHGNTLRDDELVAVAKHGVGISSTPDTEFQMGMSHPIAFKAKDVGAVASLGIDVCCSSPADMFQQMRLLIQAQRHLEHEACAGAPKKIARKCMEVLEMATMGGARAMGLENIIGSITPGKRADLLITRCDSPRLAPVHDPVGALVLYANSADVDTVFINGEIVKSKAELTVVSWPEVRKELRASVERIMERASKVPQSEVERMTNEMVKALASMNSHAHDAK